jgi:4-hydroxyacetophenone monooxygenase
LQWYENRYPGARVDTPSRSYTHLFGVDFPYPNPFCGWTENVSSGSKFELSDY